MYAHVKVAAITTTKLVAATTPAISTPTTTSSVSVSGNEEMQSPLNEGYLVTGRRIKIKPTQQSEVPGLSRFGDFDNLGPQRGRISTHLRRLWRRRRFLAVLAVAMVLSVGTTAASFLPIADQYRQVLVNVGASFIGVIATVLILEPLIESSRKPEEVIHTEFPYALFVEGVAVSMRQIRIMGAWPYTMDHPWRRPFLSALGAAAERGVRIQLLVLDPSSKAAEQRSRDLDSFDVASVITDVLISLMNLVDSLTPAAGGRVEVRVYSSLPPARMYRWDGQAISSFFPMGNWVGSDIKHYETNMNSRLAQFVDEQFELLWRDVDTIPISRYFYLRVDVALTETESAVHTLEYVTVAGDIYVAGYQLNETIRRLPQAGVHVGHIREGILESSTLSPLSQAEADDLHMSELFFRKYGSGTPLDLDPSVLRVELTPQEPSRETDLGLQRRG